MRLVVVRIPTEAMLRHLLIEGFLCAKRQAAGDGNKLVACSYASFTEAHLEDAADGGHERTAPGEEHAIDLTTAYA
jgi:hypothetical protein